jgi:hypothetical protein
MKPASTHPPCTDADLDRALRLESDGILPSSGFADAVMTAVHREAAAPAPIPFPWKRALPGFFAAVVALALLIAAIPTGLRSLSAVRSAPSSFAWQTLAAPFAHDSNGLVWLLASLAFSGVCLLLCRRFVAQR